MQENVLFNRTVRDNIALADPAMEMDQVIASAELAAAHSFILELPHGYDTLLEERGSNLSGGQRQRLAMARALLKDPAVLVLDDSLSAVDTGTEREILDALQRRKGRHTTIVIAHRLSSVMHADRILVLNEGVCVQSGDHETLAAQPGIYRRLCEIQLELDEQIEQDLENQTPDVVLEKNNG